MKCIEVLKYSLHGDDDWFTVDYQLAVLGGNLTFPPTMGRVILEHVDLEQMSIAII